MAPRFAVPLRIYDAVDFWAAGGYRLWMTEPDPDYHSESSLVGRPEAELRMSSQFEKIFDQNKRVYRHNIRPEIIALYGAEPKKPEDDFFSNNHTGETD